jgi:hypothetical protein
MTIRWFGSAALTLIEADAPYISQSQRTSLPGSSFPLLFVNQKRVVTAGSIKALNTSDTGFRISIWVLTMTGF